MSGYTVNVNETTWSLFEQLGELDHEQIVFCHDPEVGLKAIIGIHSTVLGPSLGGCRMWNYQTEQDALTDVLRLSRGMTFKAAVSGINLGGGKAVIIGDPRKDKSEALFRRFGEFVDSLGGRYITAEDVGINVADIETVSKSTKHTAGLSKAMGGSGDPSPFTARGVYAGMKACVKEVYGTNSVQNKKVLVQGVGHVGQYLVDHLIEDGAEVLIADIFDDKIKLITDKHKVKVVDPYQIFEENFDIYAPCALGATLNDESIPNLKCTIVAGAANNQLQDETVHAEELKDRGILYAPDFLINAGGIMNIDEERGGYDEDQAIKTVEGIYDQTIGVIENAKAEGINTHESAMRLAKRRIATEKAKHSS